MSLADMERENASLRSRIQALETAAGRNASRDEQDGLVEAQKRFDATAALFGERVPGPNAYETLPAYRKRILEKFKQYSPEFKSTVIGRMDSAALDLVETKILIDAGNAARTSPKPGTLLPVQERDDAGRTITRFHGDPLAWMQAFMTQGARGNLNRVMSTEGARANEAAKHSG